MLLVSVTDLFFLLARQKEGDDGAAGEGARKRSGGFGRSSQEAADEEDGNGRRYLPG